MKTIPLTQGKVALVDDEDYEYLCKYKWCAAIFDNKWYACRGIIINGKKNIMLMHREILGFVHGDGKLADHKSSNGLDNRRNNLRKATPTLNSYNCLMRRNNTSKYRGVYWKKNNQNWQAQISINGVAVHCGCFDDPISAALAYDQAAIKYRGETAPLNFPQ